MITRFEASGVAVQYGTVLRISLCSALLVLACNSPDTGEELSSLSVRSDQLVLATAAAVTANFGVSFIDIHRDVGLTFKNVSGDADQRFIVESMSAGVAFLDYDGDGFLDLFIVDGTRPSPPADAGNRLFRNVPGAGPSGRAFEDVTELAGLKHSGWGMGCAVGDYDNDGDPDLYVTYWGPDRLYRNDGGRFTEVTTAAGLGNDEYATSAAFGDVDGDGLLDLYVVNYVEFDLDDPPAGGNWCKFKGLDSYCGPMGLPASADRLYRNRGDGRFEDVSESTGISGQQYAGLGVVMGDFDDDADLDIYVANDSKPNFLFRNDGDWHLPEVATQVGLGFSENGRPQAGMGVDSGDFDGDGDLDLYVTNFSDDVNTLYQNLGEGWFADGTYASGMGAIVRPFLGWSTAFFDFDNDGWLDLFVANGHIYPSLKQHPAGLTYDQRNLLYRNLGGKFVEVGEQAGSGWSLVKASRSGAYGDFDNDGDPDLFIGNLNDEPTFLRNDGGSRNNWLGLELVGDASNRDGIGARVTLYAGGRSLMRDVRRGRGFQSQSDPRLLFGLGAVAQIDSVEIAWPSGRHQGLRSGLSPRRYHTVTEGNNVVEAGPVIAFESVTPSTGEASRQTSSPAHTGGVTAKISVGESSWDAAAYHTAGQQFYGEGRYAEARVALERAVELQPDLLPMYVNLSVVLHAGLGLFDEAALVLEQAIARDASYAEAYHHLGKVNLHRNRLAEAIVSLARATKLNPDSEEFEAWLGLAYMKTDSLQQAIGAFKRAATLAPWDPRPCLHLARIYEQLQQPQVAQAQREIYDRVGPVQRRVVHYKRKLSEYPDNVRARYLLGQTYYEQGRLGLASRYFHEALKMDSTFAPAYHGQGRILAQRGQVERAIQAFEFACHLDPTSVQAHTDLGQAYHMVGRFLDAIAVYQHAIEIRPKIGLVHSNLAMAYAMAGKLPEAVKAFQRSIALDAESVDARDGLAQVLAAQGQMAAAAAQWDTVLQLAPRHPSAAWMRRQARTGVTGI